MIITPKPIQKIPLIILTGFLGSGKTTLLNNILAQAPRTAVIINEFGTMPIDQELLKQHKILISTLSGGCLCCQVRGALMPVLKNLRMTWEGSQEKPFDRIIIETSGIATPEPLLDTILKQNWLSARYHLQAVITTVSALTGENILARFPDAQTQIAWADSIVITHTDLASSAQIQQFTAHLAKLSPAAKQSLVIKGNIELDKLLNFTDRFRILLKNQNSNSFEHGFNSISLHLKHPLAWCHLENVLLKLLEEYTDRLVRIKGVIFDPEFDHPLLIQASAGRLYTPSQLAKRESDESISRLVLITVGTITGLEEELLSQI